MDTMHLLLHVSYLLLVFFTTILYFANAYFYYVGTRFAKKDGQVILTAIWVFLVALGLRGIFNIVKDAFNLLTNAAGEPLLEDWFNLLFQIAVLAALLYFTYATVRRNPPEVNPPVTK